ncbi:casein kinase 2 regulatory subunit [Malassezia sp. CBS 17886]|nr:casein kinase 2 regulatory subunit [Malassezia sp. CBS 17886]
MLLDTRASGSMEELSSGSSDYAASTWIAWFLSTKGNEYFCEVDEDYILDRFNLTGLNTEVQHYIYALDLLTDTLDERLSDEMREQVETQARILYGLIHARYVITTRGLAKMLEKYKRADFGRCPRVLCCQQPLLPVGLSDIPFHSPVKLYCPRCEDLYSPKSTRHGSIDGAFFGTSFPHMLIIPAKTMNAPQGSAQLPRQVYGGVPADVLHQRALVLGQRSSITSRPGDETPGSSDRPASAAAPSGTDARAPVHSGTVSPDGTPERGSPGAVSVPVAPVERVVPRIFGFPVHGTSKLMAWQEKQHSAQLTRIAMFQQRMEARKAAEAVALTKKGG